MAGGRVPAAALYTGPLESGADVVALGYPGNVDLATARSAADYITPRTPVRSEGNMSNRQSVDGVAMLVHTAKISRGNSGGPLVDQCGRIVGINTAFTRADDGDSPFAFRSEEHTSELQSLMRISYAVFCLKKKKSKQ